MNGASEEFVSLFLSIVVRSMIVVCEVTERELISAAAAARAFRAPRNICGPGQYLDGFQMGIQLWNCVFPDIQMQNY